MIVTIILVLAVIVLLQDMQSDGLCYRQVGVPIETNAFVTASKNGLLSLNYPENKFVRVVLLLQLKSRFCRYNLTTLPALEVNSTL